MSAKARGRGFCGGRGVAVAVLLTSVGASTGCDSARPDAPAALATPGRAPPPRRAPAARPTPPLVVPDLRPATPPQGEPAPADPGLPDLPATPGAGPLAALPELPPAWGLDVPEAVAPEYGRRVVAAEVRALAYDAATDTLLAFDRTGGLRAQASRGTWRSLDAAFGAGVERVESAGRTLLVCAGAAAPARWSLDAGGHFAEADFTCGEAGRRTATLVDGQVYALLSPDTLGIGPVGGPIAEVRALPAPARSVAALPPVVLVFGDAGAWRSADAGAHFSPVDWPADAPLVREALFLAKARVVAVGDAPAPRGAGLVLSDDEGRAFHAADVPRHTEHLAAVAAVDNHVLAVPEAAGQAVYSANDAGRFDLLPDALAPRAAVVAGRNGFLTGDATRGVRGLAGATAPPLDAVPLRSVVFPHPRVGFAVDAVGRLRTSLDAGLTWRVLVDAGPGVAPGWRGLARLDADYGLLLGGAEGLFAFDARRRVMRAVDAGCRVTRLEPLGLGRALAQCADDTLRFWDADTAVRLPAPEMPLGAVAAGEGGRPAALSADGRTLLQWGADTRWGRRALPSGVTAVDLDAVGEALTLLLADGARWTLSRFDGAFHAAGGPLGEGRRARCLVALPGGAAVLSSEDDILLLDGEGNRRMLGLAPDAEGLVSNGAGTWIALQAQATTLLVPR
jgi:hypothetical protein